jgi:hypothetical protein
MKALFALAATAATIAALPALGHHAHGNYFQNRTINVQGRVVQVHWVNPHVWIDVEVTNAQGRKSVWPLEGTGIQGLMAKGWRPDSIKPGDTISVRCHPMKDATEACLLGFVTNINGTAMDKEFN